MKLSKKFYVGSMVAGPVIGIGFLMIGFVFGLIGAGVSQSGPRGADASAPFAVGMAGMWFFALLAIVGGSVYSVVVYYVLLYKAWSSIQDGHARTTPAQAVGFMFIPFFNVYWMFQAIWGFAVDYNKYIERHRLAVSRLPDGLFLTANILHFAMIIPFVNIAVAFVLLGIHLAVVAKMCDGVNALATAPRAAVAPAPAT